MENSVRVRFAPSPTGYLHVGGARTALYNWLFARHVKGDFILRIEDTDKSRSTNEAIGEIIKSLRWLGLSWDEGSEVDGKYGPYRQTERLDLYAQEAKRLLENEKAYLCYCSPEELKERRELALKEKRTPKYDGRCRNLSPEEKMAFEKEGRKAAIRFNCPKEGETAVDDLIRGRVEFKNEVLDDFIILRADGFPTYNFAAVMDDHLMKITHVIRGEDHLPNTPKQILIYQALAYEVPAFAHLPMILGSDKKPLSKRHGATSIEEFRKNGYLPEAMINYLVLLGWSYDEKTTLFSVDELIEKFSIERVSKNPAIWDPAKLEWMNGHYIRQMSAEELVDKVLPFLESAGLAKEINREWLKQVVILAQERMKTLSEIVDWTDFFFKDVETEEKELREVFSSPEALRVLGLAKDKLKELQEFKKAEIEKILRMLCEDMNLKPAKGLQPIRVAITGRKVSLPLFESIELLGEEKTLAKLDKTIETVKQLF